MFSRFWKFLKKYACMCCENQNENNVTNEVAIVHSRHVRFAINGDESLSARRVRYSESANECVRRVNYNIVVSFLEKEFIESIVLNIIDRVIVE